MQVFDINSRAILRTIRAHKQSVSIPFFSIIATSELTRCPCRAVHTTKFSPGAGTQILTTSSDTTVRLFDLSTSAPLRTFSLHTDYVRTASFVPSAPSLIFSGGYDGTVRLWDSRVPNGEGGGQVWLGRHGKPVEDVIVASSGTTAISAGGPIMRVWDLLGASTSRPLGEENEEQDTGTAQCLKALSNHQKTITSLCWAESEEGEARVLSGGLDGLVKVYDPQENWRVRHTMRYGGQVLSLAVSVSLSFSSVSALRPDPILHSRIHLIFSRVSPTDRCRSERGYRRNQPPPRHYPNPHSHPTTLSSPEPEQEDKPSTGRTRWRD